MISARKTLAALAGVLALTSCADPTSDGDRAEGHAGGEHGAASSGATEGGPDDHDEHGMHDMADMAGMPEVSAPPDSADFNVDDIEYLTMMVAHHRQALDLAELAPERASDDRVLRLAQSIDTTQGREIIVMATWLVDRGQPEPTPESVAAMTEMSMPGMLDQGQLDDLAASEGGDFDRRFLEDMIQHHQGAIRMAEQVLGTGKDVVVAEMASDVVTLQNAEIRRMRDLLEQLPST